MAVAEDISFETKQKKVQAEKTLCNEHITDIVTVQ